MLVVPSPEVTDAGLVNLKGLTQLQHLNLGLYPNHRRWSGEHQRLDPSPDLDLDGARITDAGLVILEELIQ